jgi:hypothetical protein
MPSKAERATKKQHLPQLSCMGVSEWQRKPSIWDFACQLGATLLGIDASLTLFTVIFGTDGFNLKFSRTIQTGRDQGLFTG